MENARNVAAKAWTASKISSPVDLILKATVGDKREQDAKMRAKS